MSNTNIVSIYHKEAKRFYLFKIENDETGNKRAVERKYKKLAWRKAFQWIERLCVNVCVWDVDEMLANGEFKAKGNLCDTIECVQNNTMENT